MLGFDLHGLQVILQTPDICWVVARPEATRLEAGWRRYQLPSFADVDEWLMRRDLAPLHTSTGAAGTIQPLGQTSNWALRARVQAALDRGDLLLYAVPASQWTKIADRTFRAVVPPHRAEGPPPAETLRALADKPFEDFEAPPKPRLLNRNELTALVEQLDVSTKPDSAVLWSGRGSKEAAVGFAASTGKTTLEMTPGGRRLEAENLFERKDLTAEEAMSYWRRLSERFARGAKGEVVAYVNNPRPTSVYLTVEKPILSSRPDVVLREVHWAAP